MKKISWAIVGFFCLSLQVKAQQDTIVRRIVLIGDGGELKNGIHPVAQAIRKVVPMDERTTILFLGDNLYRKGLPDDQNARYLKMKAVLDSQLCIADNTPAKIYMIPGNHDWENGAPGGYDAIVREQTYVDLLGKPNVEFEPKNGCPGPVEVPLDDYTTLILFDSQWWLHNNYKPEIESDCPCKTKEEVVAQFDALVAKNSKKLVLIACHHPFKTNSVHGGLFTIKQHIFPFTEINKNLYIPLPVLGSIYPIARSVFGSPQDLKYPAYQNMINQIMGAVRNQSTNVVFVAGHDHGLQLIKDSSYYYVVSGGGCKTNRVTKGKNSLYAQQITGFCVMEVSTHKNVTITYYSVTDSVRKTFSRSMLNFSSLPEAVPDSTKRVAEPVFTYKDNVIITASDKHKPISGLRKWWLGQNYRQDWSTPVTMKVFNIHKEKGGLEITSMGGGKQTRVLHLKDKYGKEWLLKTVEKNPAGILPANFRNAMAKNLVNDYIAAEYPYGAMIVPRLAKEMDIQVPKPELFYVPDDPSFGYYQKLFANQVCFLEPHDPTADGSDTKSTAKTFNKMIDENDHRPDQQTALKARLLDILIGDFERHFDQWRWGTSDTGKGKIYYPIPKDRDQAFFYSDGLTLKLASKNSLPYLKGFRNNIPKIKWLEYSARDFDRIFLTGLDKTEWEKEITLLQNTLTDSVIRKAVRDLPPEIYAISGEKIYKKLISRRELLRNAALRYYRFISRKVNIIGSNQEEYFRVSNHNDSLQVKVYARATGNDTSFIMYNRTFDPKVTHEIRLYGLNGNDLFEIDKDARSKIKFRIIGGRGNDTFDIKGNVPNMLYDLKVEGNYISHHSHSKNRFSLNPPVNSNNFTGFNYNINRYPQLKFSLNSDDGLLLGAAYSRTTYGFRNEPYASHQVYSFHYSPTRTAFRFTYDGEFNHITHDIDLIAFADLKYPYQNNFFGLGNKTPANLSLGYDYYRSFYKTMELSALLRRRYFSSLQVMIGPYYYNYTNKYNKNINRILEKPALIGLDSADIYSNKSYAGGKLSVILDNRNDLLFPTRGIVWNNDLIITKGLISTSNNFSKISSDMTVYASFKEPANLILVLGLGGERILSKNFEFFQAATVGSEKNLLGFRRYRYAGKSSSYASLEMRLKLAEIKSSLLPGRFGLTSFYNIARVSMPNESTPLHSAYGGGIFFMPYNLLYMSFTAGFTPHERSLNFTVGSKIYLNY